MIVCPRCSQENEDSAMNCASCRINLQWALENPNEAGRDDLQREEGLQPEAQGIERVASVETRPIRGFLVIVLLLAIPASLAGALWNFAGIALGGGHRYEAGFWLWVVVALVCIPAAIVVLLRRQPKPNLLGGLRILALIGLTGGLLFGLMRLTLIILPEHTGRSLTIQYKLGERDFRGANLGAADLSEADLHRANLSRADLRGANLSGANLRGADLSGANLYQADLSGASLGDADLSEANLYQADLSGVGLARADLGGADLSEANLRGACLCPADLSEANLYQADLNGASLRGADLREANLTGVRAVTGEQLDRARNLMGTILPDGSVHE